MVLKIIQQVSKGNFLGLPMSMSAELYDALTLPLLLERGDHGVNSMVGLLTTFTDFLEIKHAR